MAAEEFKVKAQKAFRVLAKNIKGQSSRSMDCHGMSSETNDSATAVLLNVQQAYRHSQTKVLSAYVFLFRLKDATSF